MYYFYANILCTIFMPICMYYINIISCQLKLIKMRAELAIANLNHCAVPFFSRAAEKVLLYYIYLLIVILYIILLMKYLSSAIYAIIL